MMKNPILQRKRRAPLFLLGSLLFAISAFSQSSPPSFPIDFRFHYLHETAKFAKLAETALPAWPNAGDRRGTTELASGSRAAAGCEPAANSSRGAWKLKDKQSRVITGKGVLIADFDTGVDFFHPLLWFADGDTLNWLDVNRNGVFDSGTDAVDENRNNSAEAGEILRYKELAYSGGNTAGVYDANLDFLYNDFRLD